jgi:hypothetical protein
MMALEKVAAAYAQIAAAAPNDAADARAASAAAVNRGFKTELKRLVIEMERELRRLGGGVSPSNASRRSLYCDAPWKKETCASTRASTRAGASTSAVAA